MIHYNIYSSVNKLPNSWDDFTTRDIFLKSDFLKAIQSASPKNITNFYVGVYKDDVLVGKAVFQHINFVLDAENKDKSSFFQSIVQKGIKVIAKGHLLVLGNLMQTGQHGYFFNVIEISNTDFFSCVNDAISELQKTIQKKHKKRVKAIMLKDYFKDDAIHKVDSFLNTAQYFKVAVQPNMILEVPKQWNSMEDYVSELHKKYRSRYKTAIKKKDIVVKELSETDIQTHQKAIFRLYKNVSNNASINSFTLPEHHFYALKTNLKDAFKVFGYFLDEELVGFFTLIENNTRLETYFLGYNSNLNHKHQLYLNMLYDMIKYGIEHDFKTIVFARTAMEIKSSVGAKPVEMVMYMKHTKPVLNSVLKFSMGFMTPKQEWQERHPFK